MVLSLTEGDRDLSALCCSVKQLAGRGDYSECEKLIAEAMSRHPHAPHPHNLMGVLLEIMDDRKAAMKHFRAAWSLDPTYLPARHNMDVFASFYMKGECAYDEGDCAAQEARQCGRVEYDSRGIGRVVRED